MNVDQNDIDKIYGNLIKIYERGEESIVYLFRSNSPTLEDDKIEAMTAYDDEFTAEEKDFILRALDQRIIAASKNMPLKLDDEQKKQVQRFYGTNAGASFINTQLRNARLKPEQAIRPTYLNLDSAVAAAANEGVSEGRISFSTAGRLAIKQAFALGDAKKVMRAALEGGGSCTTAPPSIAGRACLGTSSMLLGWGIFW